MKKGSNVLAVAIAGTPTRESIARMEASIARAIAGDYAALSDLLLLIAAEIKSGVPLPRPHADFLSEALLEIARGGDPRKALHIHRRRGQRDTRAATLRSLLLAQGVAELRRDRKLNVDAAAAAVAEAEGVPHDTVRAAWRDYRKQVELLGNGLASWDLSPKKPQRKRRRSAK